MRWHFAPHGVGNGPQRLLPSPDGQGARAISADFRSRPAPTFSICLPMLQETVHNLGDSCGMAKRATGLSLSGRVILVEGPVDDRAVRTLSIRWAPLGDQRICWLALIRRCSSRWTVLSVVAVDIDSLFRRAVA
jgi:hypothetical protein